MIGLNVVRWSPSNAVGPAADTGFPGSGRSGPQLSLPDCLMRSHNAESHSVLYVPFSVVGNPFLPSARTQGCVGLGLTRTHSCLSELTVGSVRLPSPL